jgi:mannose-1-phosphate guanylyltransferase
VAILPSDHYFADEGAVDWGLQRALAAARRRREVLILGMTPDGPDPEFGWILGREPDEDGTRPVTSFFEKPGADLARQLHRRGALWSTFIFAARVKSLLSLFEGTQPDLLEGFLASARDEAWTPGAAGKLYAALPSRDFSRDVLQRGAERLRLIQLPACGWLDVGTPARFHQWLSARVRPAEVPGGVS